VESVGRTAFDPAKGLVTLSVQLKNTSKDTLAGPLKLRLTSLRSELGDVSVANADDRGTGLGAVWDFTPQLRGEPLRPGAVTEAKTLRFRVLDLQAFQQGPRFLSNF